MHRALLALIALLTWFSWTSAQQTTFTPNCAGTDDTARFTSIIATISSNTGTIRLPYKAGTRCAVNTITIPDNITLDNSDGTGLKANTGQTVTVLGPVVNPVGRAMFFGPGSFVFTGNSHIGTNGQALVSNGLGGLSFATISGGGGGGLVDSFNGRTGAVMPATNDYNWAMIDKASGSIADLPFRSADLLSNGTTGTGQIVLRDSPVLITPVLGVATATSINGIGIAGVPGKTLTLNNSLTLAAVSDGLIGTLPATGTFALGAASLNVSSTTDVSSANHSHAVASSANPGATASILASNASGHLQLVRLGVAVAPTEPLQVNGNIFNSAAVANLFLKDTSTGWQSANTLVVTPQANNCVRSINFTSGLVGWSTCAVGDAEFGNVTVRGEIRASVFKVNEVAATAGTFGVFFSASNLSADAVIPTSGSFTFEAKNSDAGGMLFAVNDVVRFKGLSTTGVSDTWATITARTNNGTTTTYTATLNSGTASTTYVDGMAVVDYGPASTGFITLSADGTVGASPNLTMATHTGSPWSALTTRARLGNLNGSYGYIIDVYGFGAGQHGTAGQSWLTVDPTNGVRIGNNTTVLTQVDAAGNASFTGTITASAGSIGGWAINASNLARDTGTNATSAGLSPADWPFFAGATVANRATAPFRVSTAGALTATSATITGAITATSGTIGGWTINSDRLSNGTTHLAGNFDMPAGPISWFGKSATQGFQGWNLRDASDRHIGAWVGSTSAYPYLSVFDGANYRVVLGSLNQAFCADGATASMGLKIWDASCNKLVEFSDVQNIIGGAVIGPTSITTGSGNTVLDSDGVHVKASTAAGPGRAFRMLNTGNIALGGVFATQNAGNTSHSVFLLSESVAAHSTNLGLHASAPLGQSADIALLAFGNGSGIANASINVVHSSVSGHILAKATNGMVLSSTGAGGPTTSAALDIQSTTGAFIPPRMTTGQRDALTPTAGMMVWNTTTTKLQVYNGTSWVDLH